MASLRWRLGLLGEEASAYAELIAVTAFVGLMDMKADFFDRIAFPRSCRALRHLA